MNTSIANPPCQKDFGRFYTISNEDPTVSDILETSAAREIQRGPPATDEGFIITFEDNVRGFFKPILYSDRRLVSQPLENEVAAYIISETLNFQIVPHTTFREIKVYANKPPVRGTLQRYVIGETPMQIKKKTGQFVEANEKIWLFDEIIANIDRSDRNYIISEEGQWAIDNARSLFASNDIERFYKNPNYSTRMIDSLKKNPIILQSMRTLDPEILRKNLKNSLPAENIEFLIERIRTIVSIANMAGL